MAAYPNSDIDSDDHHSPGPCDVCGTTTAALRCEACHLDLCVTCSRARHLSSLHLTTGRFRFYRQEDPVQEKDESPSTTSPPDSPAAKTLPRSPKTVNSNALWGFENTLVQSLRALTFASGEEISLDSASSTAATTTTVVERRPRSFSDYAALTDTERWRALRGPTELRELWDAMRTDIASRHVVVRCIAGAWNVLDVRRIVDRLQSFGSVASTRRELTENGLLFCTFFDLSSAVTAVNCWRAGTDILSFCLPYELPNDVNSATLLVHFAHYGSAITPAEIHRVCTFFGHVASVLQPEVQAAKYIVEYSDSRVISVALNGLPRAFDVYGSLSVARTTPPTLDVSKLQLFYEFLNRAAITHSRATRSRHKSFSSNSTSLLTSPTSPTSSVASSLNASFLDCAGNNSPMASTTSMTYPGAGELTSPVLMPQDEQQIWARQLPRARSNSSSAYLDRSFSSSTFGDSTYSNRFILSSSSTLLSRTNDYSSFRTVPPLQSSNNQISSFITEQQQQSFYDLQGHQSKFISMRYSNGNNDRCVRPSAAYSGNSAHGSTRRHTTGRHDQGTGEFSLSIEKVASGTDKRTTLMIRNIPNKYTQQMLLAEINSNHRGNYDFFYLPIDFKNKCNMGYAFINFIEAAHIELFHKNFNGQKWTNFNSEKVCAISYARLQGKQAMVARFQNSSLLDKRESYRPLVFCSSGPNRGQPETFPALKQIANKKLSHTLGTFGVDDYGGSYAAHRMHLHPPSQQHMQLQQLYPQQLFGIRQHAMPPLPIANGHHGMQILPLHYISSYQPDDLQMASSFLYGVPGMPSNALENTH
ncbi:mei2-like protein [Plasmopara halstedii]|uniref:Mei2-like protein n=1 Tax=Plasmopara halstedii TaxID=4781 RepID=A0A0P1AWA2_PLAHL|nr:mei2-like protein [Plasmopara halstedii]CEG45527.1 mei2-like protein [Plasmopara halstedii]|eukprot:XP_024581896.1 mei2-like protein [Plasmopara halstedii]